MDAKYFAEIKAREQAATPGPWEYFDCANEIWSIAHKTVTNDDTVIGGTEGEGISINKPDAAFIAHARTDIPALIAEVERLQNLCEENEQLIERLANQSRRLNDSGVTKDQQIATLKKALELACDAFDYTPSGHTLMDLYIQQAQEQDGNHDK